MLIIDCDQDVTELDDCLMQSLMHVDHYRAIEALARDVALETEALHLIQVTHADLADDFRSTDFDFELQVCLNI